MFEDENKRLESVIERHVALIPKVKETQVKSEVSKRARELNLNSITWRVGNI